MSFLKRKLELLFVLSYLIIPVIGILIIPLISDNKDWPIFAYSALIILCYFLFINNLTAKLEPIKKGQESLIMAAFLSAAVLLILQFCLGWMLFDHFGKGGVKSDHTHFDAFYFSAVTFTTLGYGDFSPTSNTGKFFVFIEALMGMTHMVAFFTIINNRVIQSKHKKFSRYRKNLK